MIKLEQYRDTWLAEKMDEVIGFYPRIAYANRDKRRSDWNEVKLSIMEELLRLKIEQNPYVKKKHLQTEDYIIVEDSPKDSFWGWGPNRDGENQLGKLWMKLREEIRKDSN